MESSDSNLSLQRRPAMETADADADESAPAPQASSIVMDATGLGRKLERADRPESTRTTSYPLRSTVQRSHSVITPPRSASHSPRPSRESSPSRQLKPSAIPTAKSRPQRTAPTRPGTAAATASPAASSSTPPLRPVTAADPPVGDYRIQTTGKASRADDSPHRTRSTRLKSPPPSASSVQAALLASQTSPTPAVVIQRAHSASATTVNPQFGDAEADGHLAPPGMRTPTRGPSVAASILETVQEGSTPSTPALDPIMQTRRLGENYDGDHSASERPEPENTNVTDKKGRVESSSDSGDNRAAGGGSRRIARANSSAHLSRSNTLAPSAAYSALNPKVKVGPEASVQSMTVETETVSSVPQVAVGGGTGERGGSLRVDPTGSLRLKSSVETIRPRKDRKRTTRKTTSLNSGTGAFCWPSCDFPSSYACPRNIFMIDALLSHDDNISLVIIGADIYRSDAVSSRADVFEAKVASAVDEANSSDSEETFVYESNPPEPHLHRSSRHHSRTPSSTSVHSQMEHRAAMLVNHSLAGKRSMKFASNSYIGMNASDHETAVGLDSPGHGRGSGRGNSQTGSHHSHPHHAGHWGHPGRAGQASLFDHGSPFTQGQKAYRAETANRSRQSSRPTSPREGRLHRLGSVNAKKFGHISTYDLDMEGGADDERTPLVSSNRPGRRRMPANGLLQGEYAPTRRRTWLTRFAGCLVLTSIILLVVVGAMAIFLATTKALSRVRVYEIQNVLASEQEIMLDLVVEAVNPNVIPVTVRDMDVNLFAKSRHVGGGDAHQEDGRVDSWRVSRPQWRRSSRVHTSTDGVDEGTDPMPADPGSDSQTMLLGRIFQFDSAPTFDGSPLSHRVSSSIGEVRLAKPGNKTEEGGSARWERVIQHPFELIVRGVLKYQLPLSSQVRTAPIGASVLVHPEQGVDRFGRMYVEPLPGRGGNVVLHRPGRHPDDPDDPDDPRVGVEWSDGR